MCFSLQEVKFAYPDGCKRCAETAYDAYPLLTWAQFCAAFAESKAVKDSFDQAVLIKAGKVPQPFKVRGAVQSANALGVELSKPYIALTEDEVLAMFRVPAAALDPDLRFTTLANENGEPCKFYLFEDGGYRKVTFYSRRLLEHFEHLQEPQAMLRQEQPLERYKVLAKDEVVGRNGIRPGQTKPCLKILSIQDARARAEQIITSRHAQEASGEAHLAGEEPAPDHDQFEGVQTISAATDTSGQQRAPDSKAKARPKRQPKAGAKPAATNRRGRGTEARSRSPMPESVAPSATPGRSSVSTAGGSGSPALEDELVKSIKGKLGGDMKSVSNLNVARVLQGEQIGRTVAGASLLHVWSVWGHFHDNQSFIKPLSQVTKRCRFQA